MLRRQIIIAAVMCLMATTTYAETIMEVNLVFRKGPTEVVYLDSVRFQNGGHVSADLKGDYRLKVFDVQENVVADLGLPVYYIILTDPPQESDEAQASVRFPLADNLARLEVTKSGKSILTYALRKYCDKDNHCNTEFENYLSCSWDCPKGGKDGWCDNEVDHVCDLDCLEDVDHDCKEISRKGLCGDGVCYPTTERIDCPDDCGEIPSTGLKGPTPAITPPLTVEKPTGSQVKTVCGDGICEPVEKGMCPRDCEEDKTYLYPVLLFVFGGAIVLLYLRKRNATVGQLK